MEGCKTEENQEQIQECLFNIKSIFERSEANNYRERLEVEQNDEGEPIE
jgi:hypothetical protein